MRAQSKILALVGASVLIGVLLTLGVHSRDQSAADPVGPRSVRGDISRTHSPGQAAHDAETPPQFHYWPLTSDGQ